MSNGTVTVNDELEKNYKKAAMAYFKIPSSIYEVNWCTNVSELTAHGGRQQTGGAQLNVGSEPRPAATLVQLQGRGRSALDSNVNQ